MVRIVWICLLAAGLAWVLVRGSEDGIWEEETTAWLVRWSGPEVNTHDPEPVQVSAAAPSVIAPKANPDAYSLTYIGRHQQLYDDINAWMTYDAVAVGDVTGDGRDDLVAIPTDNRIQVFVQDANGHLSAPVDFELEKRNLSPPELVLADFNEDGVRDVAIASIQGMFDTQGGITLLLSNGNGGLELRQALGTIGLRAMHWAVMDADEDGHLDIVGYQYGADYSDGFATCGGVPNCTRSRFMYGDGHGGFGRVETVGIQVDYNAVGAGTQDLNGDGRNDLVYSLEGTVFKQGRAFVRYQLPGGGLAPARELHPSHNETGSLLIGDVNGDGRMDSLVIKGDFLISPAVRLQDANGDFGAPVALPSYANRTSWPNLADFDGDGKTDLVSVQQRPVPGSPISEVGLGIYLQRNGSLGIPTFGNSLFELDKVAYGHYALSSGDLNGDGCRDLVVAASYEGILFFKGDGCIRHPTVATSGSCRLDEVLPALGAPQAVVDPLPSTHLSTPDTSSRMGYAAQSHRNPNLDRLSMDTKPRRSQQPQGVQP